MNPCLHWPFSLRVRGALLGLTALLGCRAKDANFTLYLQSQDLMNAHPLVVYLDTTALVTLRLAPNDLPDYYNTVCCLRRGLADSLTVVVHDTIMARRLLPRRQWSKIFIKVRSIGKQRDYTDPAVPLYLYEAGVRGTYNLTQAVDSLYDQGLLPEKVVQVSKDSLIHISFQ